MNIQGINAKGWLGIERRNSKWIYSKSGDEPTLSPNSWNDKTFDGHCVYLKGKNGEWTADSCREVRSFICEFTGTLFCMLRTLQADYYRMDFLVINQCNMQVSLILKHFKKTKQANKTSSDHMTIGACQIHTL